MGTAGNERAAVVRQDGGGGIHGGTGHGGILTDFGSVDSVVTSSPPEDELT